MRGRNWDSVRDGVPDGPVLVELLEPAVSDPEPRPGLCIAAPFAPKSSGFEQVETQPLAQVLDALCEWVLARVPTDTRIIEEPARALLRERVDQGLATTLGDALGWLGLLDELGARELRRPLDRVVRRFVERRVLAALDPASPHATWVRRSIYPLLLGLCERVFTDSDAALEAPRTLDQWMALVPPEVERSVDVEWMRLSLARVESTVRPSDLERAARQLPPGAFRVVTALERGGVLVARDGEELRLAPAWLRSALARLSVEALIERSPFEWGEALLRAHAAPPVARALFERTLAIGGSALEPVLDLEAEDQPAYAAAIDVAFRVAGVSRLMGADVSVEVLDGLLAETARLAIELPLGLPVPRIELLGRAGGVAPAGGRSGHTLLEQGTFFLAALSVTELAGTPTPRLGALDPWHGTRPSPALIRAYDRILDALEPGPAWRNPAFALVMRARAVIGNSGDPELPHPLERPAQILDEVEHGVLSWATLGDDGDTWLEPLFALAAIRHVPLPTLVRAIWSAWDDALRPASARFLAPAAPRHALFWKHIPESLLDRLLVDVRRHHVPYAIFGAEQWRAFARALSNNPDLVAEAEAFPHMPQELAFTLLGSELPWRNAKDSLGALWARFPDELRASVRDRLRSTQVRNAEGLTVLLEALPAEQAPALLAELGKDAARSISPTAARPLRLLLHRLIAERTTCWRDAYALLSDVERELRRVAL